MKSQYVVQINMKKGPSKYLNAETNKLVSVRSRATRMPERVARIVSDHFWENYWRDSLYDSRELCRLNIR